MVILVCLLEVLSGCRRSTAEKLDTPTAGRIAIGVDETLRPLLEAEERAFEGFHQADLEVIYVPEAEAADLLVNDSVRMAILCRKPDSREEELYLSVSAFCN